MLMNINLDVNSFIEKHRLSPRMLNWARWAMVRPVSGQTTPMFKQYRSKYRQWHMPEIRDQCDEADAVLVEEAVVKLNLAGVEAIRWAYLCKSPPWKEARRRGITVRVLNDSIVEALGKLNFILG